MRHIELGELLFSFEGRINRAKFWLALLISGIAQLVAGALIIASYALMGDFFALGAIAVFFLIVIPIVVSGFAVGIKRLHDRDKSGWWLLLFYVVPAILETIAQSIDDGGWPWAAGAAALTIWMIVELGCPRGTPGYNTYGRDPLEGAETPHA